MEQYKERDLPDEPFVTAVDMADMLHVSYQTALRLVRKGEFPIEPIRVGSRYLFRMTDVRSLINGETSGN